MRPCRVGPAPGAAERHACVGREDTAPVGEPESVIGFEPSPCLRHFTAAQPSPVVLFAAEDASHPRDSPGAVGSQRTRLRRANRRW